MSISGNAIVDEISNMRINSIPEAWYRTVRQGKQPNALAILVLWDLLYWYKWVEIRDEATGMVIGYKKKFKADLLQRSYDSIAAKFGITKTHATAIIKFLEDLGVLKRIFRTITVGDVKCSNVLFIELVPSVIKAISKESNNIAPCQQQEEEVSGQDMTPPPSENRDPSLSKSGEGSSQKLRQIQSTSQSYSQPTSQSNFLGASAPDEGTQAEETNDRPPEKTKKEKPPKHKYGEFNNVLLTDGEYQKLVDKLGKEKTDAVVKNYSEIKEMKGYKYNSDYMALLKWGINAYESQSRSGSYSRTNTGNGKPFYKGFDKEALNRKISLLDGVEAIYE